MHFVGVLGENGTYSDKHYLQIHQVSWKGFFSEVKIT